MGPVDKTLPNLRTLWEQTEKDKFDLSKKNDPEVHTNKQHKYIILNFLLIFFSVSMH